ncbi:helix-turn-helix domain-containing protein [bacterium]|nr:helix-turn-helix domain-containing protein [bacterium]
METLAQFVQRKRESLGLTPFGLSKKCNVPAVIIEEIEAGRELFLSVTVRQNLAKGLRCLAEEIKALEKDFEFEEVPMEVMDVLKQRILNGETELYCPKCKSPLKVRIEQMYDLEDNLVYTPRGYCTKCVFQVK